MDEGETGGSGGREKQVLPATEKFEETLAHLEDDARLVLATPQELAVFNVHLNRLTEALRREKVVAAELGAAYGQLWEREKYFDADPKTQTLYDQYMELELPDLPHVGSIEQDVDRIEEYVERQLALVGRMQERISQLDQEKKQ